MPKIYLCGDNCEWRQHVRRAALRWLSDRPSLVLAVNDTSLARSDPSPQSVHFSDAPSATPPWSCERHFATVDVKEAEIDGGGRHLGKRSSSNNNCGSTDVKLMPFPMTWAWVYPSRGGGTGHASSQWLKCRIRGGGTLHSGLDPWQWSCAFP